MIDSGWFSTTIKSVCIEIDLQQPKKATYARTVWDWS